MMTIADKVRADQYPLRKAIALMSWRDTSNPLKVVFHFTDDSTVTFKKVYELEPLNGR